MVIKRCDRRFFRLLVPKNIIKMSFTLSGKFKNVIFVFLQSESIFFFPEGLKWEFSSFSGRSSFFFSVGFPSSFSHYISASGDIIIIMNNWVVRSWNPFNGYNITEIS